MSVVTRFAPSPTGYLHIGGARTALFNWLFARKMGGRYLLRIEDTDRARSTDAAIAAIIDGLDWLGLSHDGEITHQFSRAARHREAAEAMIARGTAFRCYCSPDEVETLRAEAHAQGRALRSPWRDGGERPGAPHVIRLRAPDDGDVLNADLIQGDVRIKARDIDDLVLLRADGTPTYMLSVVVDDHDMGVTHVIRGDDHLTNAARQIPIFRAMAWTPPKFAHVPLIHGEDGKKLSKRHGAQAVHEYRDMGYLPEAVAAYLMRLGWSPGHDDILSKEEAIAQFDVGQIGKGPARLDFKKLDFVNAHFMGQADDARLAQLLGDHLKGKGEPSANARTLARIAGALKTRAKTIPDLAEQARFVLAKRPLPFTDSAKALLSEAFRARLARLSARLSAESAWEHGPLGAALKAFATEEGVGLGQIGPGLRAALTGGAPAPDLGLALELLGREEALARMSDQI
ncbi:MAG: glutamate--tRNA ligase [Hyphomonadaceae bacterium]|nr:glutamate--tRNA ligase [Hyphomonadaceae bacterium]